MHRGYVRLHRKSLDSRVFRNADTWKVWSWCLMKASHKERWATVQTGRGDTEIQIQPGQFVFGRKVAATELNMKPSSVRNHIKKLQDMQNLDIQPDTHFSVITILNWETYQSGEIEDGQASGQALDNQRTGNGQAMDTDKNVKNVKNVKNNSSTSPNGDASANCPSDALIRKYHEILPELPRIEEPVTVKKTLRIRWREKKERQSIEWWETLFHTVKNSDYLMGRVKDWQCPGLNWIIGPQNLPKILNGNYRNRNKNGLSATSQHNFAVFSELMEEVDGLGD